MVAVVVMGWSLAVIGLPLWWSLGGLWGRDRVVTRRGRDGVVSGDHDHLDAGRAALGHGVRHGRSRRVDHGDESDEPQSFQRKIHLVRVERVPLNEPTASAS